MPHPIIMSVLVLLAAGEAQAAKLKNADNAQANVLAQSADRKQAITLAPGAVFDSGGSEVSVMLNYSGWVRLEAQGEYVIYNGNIIPYPEAKERAEAVDN